MSVQSDQRRDDPWALSSGDMIVASVEPEQPVLRIETIAPWIVRLEDGIGFTRNLFTRSDAHWHLWDKEPGICARSRGSLDDMWKHFRRFNKVQNEDGKWFYFRFWEPTFIKASLAILNDLDRTFRSRLDLSVIFLSFRTKSA